MALLEGRNLAIATDVKTYARGKKPTVLIGVASSLGSLVIAIDASEYDGLELARLAGFPDAAPSTAFDKASVTRYNRQ